uniref:U1-hexatoxin-Iw1a n=1 Tax=Illawarra wisharti TaxID=278061 RepID=T7358_ILLWI|nr:RecName: Full=U1-hexatoxin-Iw1a; Short=U1-HXTX-Iw1a; AltName: Full=Atracotoxin-Hs20f7358; Short=AcTx-Hs20f7358; Flags: Precursor [Hadronyche sp. 20]AAX11345.1 ACTX-Hs20f7358 precursor [Hadronyche sp. 20]
MLKFVVVICLVIMAITFAEKCGDQECGEGTCCLDYSQQHCSRLGKLYDMCSDPNDKTDSGSHIFFCQCETGLRCDKTSWSCQKG